MCVCVNGSKMSSELTEDQINAIEAIAHCEGTCYKLDVKPATSKGDGYMGSLFHISIKCERNNLELILKQSDRTYSAEYEAFVRKSYIRELHIYNNILKEFDIFQNENNVVNGFTGHAKIYGSSDKENYEYLILENLKENGYKMWDRKIPMDDEHVALVFSEYGKFHAVSLAMRAKKSDLFKELTDNLDDCYSSTMSDEKMSDVTKEVLQTGFKAVESNGVAFQLFKKFADVAEEFILEVTQNLEEQLVVIHGDCWCNNMLFKYQDIEGDQKPNKVCFIDWQLSKIGSPVLDLAYFFFVCTTGDILRDCNKYLKIYHNAVAEVLTQFSCDIEKLFPYALLEYHWNKYAKFGLYIAILTMNFMLCETNVQTLPGLVIPGESGQEDTEYEDSSRGVSEYDQRIIDIINVMAENNLI